MSISSLMNNTVTVIKDSGERFEGIKASVQTKKIFINGSKPLIESGDIIECAKSNGAVDRYEVIDPGFYEEFSGMDAHYQIEVRNLGVKRPAAKPSSVTYNVSGTNARVNNDSVDQSTNIGSGNAEVQNCISDLRSNIEQSTLEPDAKAAALQTVDVIEQTANSEAPSKHVIKTLLDSLGPIANVAGIASAIMAAL